MPKQATVVAPTDCATRTAHPARVHAFVLAVALATAAAPVRAVDGCLLLLCLAAPSWRAVAQCVPPVTQALRDLARGRPFPTCAMAGPGNTASHRWASAPDHCPVQYTRAIEVENGFIYQCDYDGAISVSIDGSPWARTWWSMSGGPTVTEYSPTAKATLGSWDPQFEIDYVNWLAAHPPHQPPCTGC